MTNRVINGRDQDHPVVFIVQEQHRLNYGDAERFGHVEFITRFEYSPIGTSIRNSDIVVDARKAIERFNPDKDYLLLTGNLITVGYVFALALAKSPSKSLRLLQWDREQGKYKPVVFTESGERKSS